jgi:hypothetical protein
MHDGVDVDDTGVGIVGSRRATAPPAIFIVSVMTVMIAMVCERCLPGQQQAGRDESGYYPGQHIASSTFSRPAAGLLQWSGVGGKIEGER